MAWTALRTWVTGEVVSASLLNAQIRDNLAELVRVEQSGFRNQIVNGSFRINQRAYVSGTALPAGNFGFDRWKATTVSSSMTFTPAVNGQTVTINSGGSFGQVIERANVPAGVYILSWTGTATGRAYNSGAAGGAFAASPIVVTVDGTADLVIDFTAVAATQTLGNVQFEPGALNTGATAFERRSIGTELSLCQRYFFRSTNNAAAVMGAGVVQSATNAVAPFTLPVTMRAVPTLSFTGNNYLIRSAADFTVTAIALGAAGDNRLIRIDYTSSGMTAGQGCFIQNQSGSFIDFFAEL